MTHRILFAALSIAALGACADTHTVDTGTEEPALEAGKADGVDYDNWTFFAKTGDDYRRCMFPLCGGMYVGRVNQSKVKCGGTWQKSCYVAQYDFSAIAEGAAAEELAQLARAGKLVVRGAIKNGFYPEFPDVNVMSVTEAWSALTEVAPTGIFYRAHDLGLMCITSPCVSTELTRLNRNVDPVTRVAGADLGPAGLDDAQLGFVWDEMRDDAVVLVGKLVPVTGPGGKAQTILASQVYTRYRAADPTDATGQACGGRAGACPEGWFCQFTDALCGAADGQGQCEVPPTVCTEEYAPVCGCDGVTYANDCERKAAGAGFGTPGQCRVAAGCKLGGCGGELCLDLDDEDVFSICVVRPTDHCYQEHGVCEKQADGCGWTPSDELEACLASPGGSTPADQNF